MFIDANLQLALAAAKQVCAVGLWLPLPNRQTATTTHAATRLVSL